MPSDNAIKNHPAERRLFQIRIIVVSLIMLAMLGLLLARISWLQLFQHEYYQTRSQSNRMRVAPVQPVRGLIYDRNGTILAENLPAYYLVMYPEQVPDTDAALDALKELVNITEHDREQLKKQLKIAAKYQAVPIKTDLSDAEVARFEVNQQRFPGIEIKAGLTRHYPLGAITAHLTGHVGNLTGEREDLDPDQYRGATQIGKSGVEYRYEDLLRGQPGWRMNETNSIGRTVQEMSYTPPEAGHNIYLTIDARLQKIAYEALGNVSGSIVALDPKTGEVLAMVSKPSYDPNLFVNGITVKAYQALINNPQIPLYNRAIQGHYPPGSVVKPVMAIAALENDIVDPDKPVWCPGYITLKGSSHRFRDWLRRGHGWINMRQAIARSSDVYFYKLADEMGIDTIHEYGNLFSLGLRTGIDLPSEQPGLMPSREWKRRKLHESWYPGETLITAIGQGNMTATPLQLAQMTSQIAERGQGYVPHIMRSSQAADTLEQDVVSPIPLTPIKLKDDHHWDIVINGMRDVVNDVRGSSHNYAGRNLSYDLAGKSGTAQVTEIKQGVIAPDIKNMPYNKRPHALFTAFAPADDPAIVVAVIVEHGGGGSSVASPIARQVVDAYLFDMPANTPTSDAAQP